ncbi:MAG: hypothetical protein RIQ54_288 [Candidatus Parcubacteria bacterium]|jgi:hypothetical protein
MPKEQFHTNNWLFHRYGFSSVEILLSVALFSIIVFSFMVAYLYGEESSVLAGNRARAVLLAQEGLEAVRNMRDGNFDTLVDGSYGLAVATGTWIFSGSSDVTGIFTRTISIASLDANRKHVTSTVTWQQNAQRTGSVSLATRLMYWMKFAIGNWANPNTLASSVNISGNNDGLRVALQGNYAYLVRNGGTPNFAIINISNPSSTSLSGSLSLSGTPDRIFVSGNYAYIASSDNASELQVVNVSNPASPSLVGSYNASGNANAHGFFISGTRGYLVRDSSANDELIILDMSDPTTPALLGSLNLGNTGYQVAVVSSTAYIASSDNASELQVVNVSNPASPALVGSLNLAGNTDAITVATFSTRVILGQGSNMNIVNVTTSTSPALLGTYAAGGTVNDVFVGNDNTYVFLATANGANEFQVVNITTSTSPVLVGGFNAGGTLSGIAWDGSTDYAYGASADNSNEFSVFSP